jgi:multimeric flavodoxin WrbA
VVRRLLVVHHSRTGSTASLRDEALAGAAEAAEAAGAAGAAAEAAGAAAEAAEAAAGDVSDSGGVEIRSLGAFDAAAEDVLAADAILLCTPANFGYMSGAMKDFFERIYHPCLDRTAGRPYALIVKGDTDVDGAAGSVTRIVAGLRWREIRPPLMVVGPAGPDELAAARDLGATIAASLILGIL